MSEAFPAYRHSGLNEVAIPLPNGLFLRPLALSEPHTQAPAVFIDEFNSGFLKSIFNFLNCFWPPGNLSADRFQSSNGWLRNR